MHLTISAAQFPVTLSIQHNLACIQAILNAAQPGDWVIFPEGAVSGYSTDVAFLDMIDSRELESALESLRIEALNRQIHLWAGACYRQAGHWFNTAWGFDPAGNSYIYRKINLATHERGVFTAGADLPVFHLTTSQGVISVGVQLCRELRFPEQWGWLARSGAQVILHLNNAVDYPRVQPVWRSHLISRAAETQRFVVSVNNASPRQNSPTIVIAPDGQVLGELITDQTQVIRVDLDLSLVSNVNLAQCRTDIVTIQHV
jgi:predicted amidohydrolase